MTTKIVLLITFILISINFCYTQNDTSKVQRITLTDGSKLIGRVVSDSTSKVVF